MCDLEPRILEKVSKVSKNRKKFVKYNSYLEPRKLMFERRSKRVTETSKKENKTHQ